MAGDQHITDLILEAAGAARRDVDPSGPEMTCQQVDWPVTCTVGPGLEGAIACETRVGYVNGARGELSYRGYDIFDLCAHSTYEEVAYLLLVGQLPTAKQLQHFAQRLVDYRALPGTLRTLMGVAVEAMHPMAALRIGTNLMRQRLTWRDDAEARPPSQGAIAADEDSIAMETAPRGEQHAIYEFKQAVPAARPDRARSVTDDSAGLDACIHLISGMATLAAAIRRIRDDKLPIDPDPDLGHAANFLYMMTGRRPSAEAARVMDVALILHADHGMNASTFASLVVASTLSDIYFSIGAGIGALSGPLHGGANEEVLKQLEEIGGRRQVAAWFEQALRDKRKIMGMGHRVYRTYDPRARILAPLAEHLIKTTTASSAAGLFKTAQDLERRAVAKLGKAKRIFPNVDFYSGLVYKAMDIPRAMFTPVFAVSRVAGWTARIHEYLENNRIFRPRSMYAGDINQTYVPIAERARERVAPRRTAQPAGRIRPGRRHG